MADDLANSVLRTHNMLPPSCYLHVQADPLKQQRHRYTAIVDAHQSQAWCKYGLADSHHYIANPGVYTDFRQDIYIVVDLIQSSDFRLSLSRSVRCICQASSAVMLLSLLSWSCRSCSNNVEKTIIFNRTRYGRRRFRVWCMDLDQGAFACLWRGGAKGRKVYDRGNRLRGLVVDDLLISAVSVA